jgi:hypothetical protein
VIATSLAVAIAACAEPEEQSLCTVFDRFQEAAAQLEQVAVDGGRAGEAAEGVEQVLGQVQHLQAVADNRYATELNQLEDALDDLLRTLESIEEDADASTWEPLVEDSAEDARQAAGVVVGRIGAVCGSADTSGT